MPIDPLLTVLMPVRNGGRYIRESVDSILAQSWRDFEFLIIDDCSSDNTAEVLRTCAIGDSRIRICRIDSCIGTPEALNRGLELARGAFIARMDADDVALPDRLRTQVSFMERHPEIAVCGSGLRVYEDPKDCWIPPLSHEAICVRMLFECPLYHPTVLMRKKVANRFRYSSDAFGAADYEFWQRIAMDGDVSFANIPQALIRYRTHPSVDRAVYKLRQRQVANEVRLRMLATIDLQPDAGEFACHRALSRDSADGSYPPLSDCHAWLDKIWAANRVRPFFDQDALAEELDWRWADACVKVASFRRSDAKLVFSVAPYRPLPQRARTLTRMAWHWWKHDCKPQ